ncbi:hypothetical protein PRIPAC_96687 [Pristionchus pacificus]|uniref:Uncharacterized protein n=1 Tax=Pristionchus pacificus TaxID=54126 RepID=A0A2A6BJF7_PRIPA|nr:hypothetical protein PRIPAC_96687 [Pristionchus pacificus]|eukprot:PDM66054.1 hypothetical protein PRIPAC_45279 [Pristionchus pacificus]
MTDRDSSPVSYRRRRLSSNEEFDEKSSFFSTKSIAIIVICLAVFYNWSSSSGSTSTKQAPITSVFVPNESICYATCRLRIAESLPTSLTLGQPKLSTFDAWSKLITGAKRELTIAAYKSSLQGKHVLGDLHELYSLEGDSIFELLMDRGLHHNLTIKMVENYPPKDNGDNEDAMMLHENGAANRRYLTISKVMGRGKMHSKFLLADNKNFYLGSANLDWRSLNQKLELGVFVENCPCLGNDLRRIYDVYDQLTHGVSVELIKEEEALYNKRNPLTIQVDGAPTQVYIAKTSFQSSPPRLNNPGRTHDLDAILETINSAEEFVNLHVMDYFPLFVYRKPQEHWGKIDDALRSAVVRGVKVRMLTAALHYPDLLTSFLRSLQALDGATPNSSIEVKVFKVPADENAPVVISRERRTHKKLLVTEKTVVIGNSNWSGDYFESGTTGTAFIMNQTGDQRPLVEEMVENFERDFNSEYAHPVEDYFEKCIQSKTGSFCEGEKDPTLFAPKM